MEETITGIITSLGFSSIESFMALLVVGLAVIGALIVVITFRPLMEYYPYTYPNSRVRAKIGKIFNDKQLTELPVHLGSKQGTQPVKSRNCKTEGTLGINQLPIRILLHRRDLNFRAHGENGKDPRHDAERVQGSV